MKLLLNHYYFANSKKEFEINLPSIQLPNKTNIEKCYGLYEELSDKVVGLITYDGRLFVMLDDITIEVDESFSVRHEAEGHLKKLTIEKESKYYSIEYVNDRIPVTTPYYSESEEDADFGL